MEVLIREAADALNLIKERAASWMLPLSALKSTKIKKSLAVDRLGFLLQSDHDALMVRFESSIQSYRELEKDLSKPSWDTMLGLGEQIADANKAISHLEQTAGRITDERANFLYPRQQTRTKRRDKRTLKERLNQLDFVVFVNHFGPYEACGIPRFAVSDATAFEKDGTLNIPGIDFQFRGYMEHYPTWEDVLKSWWESEVLTRYA
jgi:hypothetical protein